MTNQNLGLLLKRAGVKGGKPYMPMPDVERSVNPQEFHESRAERFLPMRFNDLRTVHTGKQFTGTLRNILEGLRRKGEQGVVTEHVVYGLVQVLHRLRDNTAGARRTGFTKYLIPRMLSVKNQVKNGKKKGLCEFILEKIADLES